MISKRIEKDERVDVYRQVAENRDALSSAENKISLTLMGFPWTTTLDPFHLLGRRFDDDGIVSHATGCALSDWLDIARRGCFFPCAAIRK